jgi:phosphoglycolate phosphatase
MIVLFDFDGVLADTLDDILCFSEIVCSQLGHPRQPTPGDLDALDLMSFHELGKKLALPEDKAQDFATRCVQMFTQRQLPPKIFDGMQEVVAQLSARAKIGIITGNSAKVVFKFLDQYGLAGYVSQVMGGDLPGTRADKIRTAVNCLGTPEDDTYMVGDAVSDIRAAREASVMSVAVCWGHQSGKRLLEAGPDYLVHSPKELLAILDKRTADPRVISPALEER